MIWDLNSNPKLYVTYIFCISQSFISIEIAVDFEIYSITSEKNQCLLVCFNCLLHSVSRIIAKHSSVIRCQMSNYQVLDQSAFQLHQVQIHCRLSLYKTIKAAKNIFKEPMP